MDQEKEMKLALGRMDSYYRKSREGKKSDPLSEMLRKDTSGWHLFDSVLPDPWDFPIYTYYKRDEDLLFFRDSGEFVKRFNRKGKFPQDLFWCKQNKGD